MLDTLNTERIESNDEQATQKNRRGPKRRAIFIDAGEARRRLIGEDGKAYLPPTLTPDQVATLLQCSRQNITQHCRTGEIKAQRLGSLWIIGRAEVQRLLGAAEIAAA
jgi:excisionase family DNA binding protein